MKRKQVGKIIAFVLALCLVTPAISVTTVSADNTGSESSIIYQQSLIINGGFEEYTGGLPVDWSLQGSSAYKVETESDFMMLGNGEAPYAAQSITENIKGGTTYTVTARVKRMSENVRPFLDIWTNGQTSPTDVYRFYKDNFYPTVGEWETMSITFTTQENVNWLKVRIGSRGDLGTIYWDDIALNEEGSNVNLVTNGDFEGEVKSHVPDDWTMETADWVKAGIHYGMMSTVAEGVSAIRFDGADAADDNALVQEISNVAEGTAYTVSGQVLIDAEHADVTPKLTVTYLDNNGNAVGAAQTADCSIASAGNWSEIALESEVPAGAAKAAIKVGAEGAGSCTWDDIQFVQTNMLTNGGFEVTGDTTNNVYKMVSDGTYIPYIYQTVVLEEAGTYAFSVDAMTESADMKAFSDIYVNGARIAEGAKTHGIPTNGTWDSINRELTAAAGDTVKIRLGSRNAGTVYYDNVSLRKKDGDGSNLLINGDFEGANIAVWVAEECKAPIPGVHYGIENIYGSNNEYKLVGDGGYYNPHIYQTMTLAESGTYVFSAKARTESEGLKAFSDIYVNGARIADGAKSHGIKTDGTWDHISREFTVEVSAAEGSTVKIRLGLKDAAGTVYWDDVSLCKKDSNEELLLNSDFEDGSSTAWNVENDKAPIAGVHYGIETVNKSNNEYMMVSDGVNVPYIWQTVTVEEAGTYVFVGKVKTESEGMNAFSDLYEYNNGSQTERIPTEHTSIDRTGSWTSVYRGITVEAGASIKVRLGSRTAGTIYWDDVTLCKDGTTYNLLQNGDFETTENGQPTIWIAEQNAGLTAGTHYGISVDNTMQSSAYKMINDGTYQPFIYQTVAVEGGKTYVFSAETKSETSGLTAFRDIYVYADTSQTNRLYQEHGIATDGTWDRVNVEIPTAAGDTSVKVRLGIRTAGTLYWDNVALYEKDGDGTNLLGNGNFETAAGNQPTVWIAEQSSAFTAGIHYGIITDNEVPNNAYKMISDGTYIPYVWQAVTVEEAGTYVFTAKAKTESSGLKAFSDLYVNGARIADGAKAHGIPTDGTWDTISREITASTGDTIKIRLGLREAAGTLYWDDVTLSRKDGDGSNLLRNGNFEVVQNNQPTVWTAEQTDALAAGEDYGVYTIVNYSNKLPAWTLVETSGTVDTIEGDAELKLTGDSTAPYMTQRIEGLTGDIAYTLTAYVKSTTGSKPFMDVQTNGKTTGDVYRFYKEFGTAADSWEKIEISFTTQSDVTWATLRLGFRGTAGTICWDDLTLCKTGTEDNLIANGDFEGAVTDHVPAGWAIEASDAIAAGTNYDVTRVVAEGARAAVLTGTDVSVSQNISSLESGITVYAVSAMLNKLEETAAPALTVTYYDAQGQALGAAQAADCTAAEVGTWTEVYLESIVPTGAAGAVVTAANTGAGTCYWDDVRFALPVEPEPIDPDELAAQQVQDFQDMLAAEAASATPEVTIDRTTGYQPPYEGQSNLVKNWDFEENNDTTESLANWSPSNTSWGMLAVGEGYNGSDCIRFSVPEAAGAQNPVFAQWVDVVGGAEYQISFKYRISGTIGNPAVKFESWSDREKPGAQHVNAVTVVLHNEEMADYTGRENCDSNTWYTHTERFYPVATAKDVEMNVRWLANGKVNTDNSIIWIDDVELYMVNPPKTFELTTDSIFYYSDEWQKNDAKGFITAAIDVGYFPDLANGAAYTFEIKDPSAATPVLWSTTGVSENGNCTVEFPLNVMTEKEHRYEVVATLLKEDGTTILQREVQNIFVYDRVGSLDVNGKYHPYVYDEETGTGSFSDEVFYPEYAYHVNYDLSSQYKDLEDTGINLVQMSAFYSVEETLHMLDLAQEAGVMGMLCFYKDMIPAANPSNIDMTVKVINAVKNHPAVFGYSIMDESYLRLGDPSKELENAFRLIRSLDPNHPVMVNEVVERYFGEAAKYVDILSIDPYAQAYSQKVAANTTLAVQSVANKKPVYALLEAYRTGTGRYPTANDLRNNIWQALISGASAVGYLSITDSDFTTDHNGNVTYIPIWDAEGGRLWDALKEFNEKEKALAYDHFVFDKTPVFNEYIGEDYWYSSWQTDNAAGGKDLYMVVLSMLEEKESGNSATQEVSIPLISTDGSTAIGRFQAVPVSGRETTEIVGGNGSLDITLAGSEVILYKINAVDDTYAADINVTVTDENGEVISNIQVTGDGEYTVNQTVTVEAPLRSGYNLLGWYEAIVDGNGEVTGYNEVPKSKAFSYQFTAEGDLHLAAVYEELAIVAATSDLHYQKGAGGDTAVVYCTGSLGWLEEVQADGAKVDEAFYTLAEGSTVVTFKTEYLETLSAGMHTVKLIYSGGNAEVTLTIAESTGDGNNSSGDGGGESGSTGSTGNNNTGYSETDDSSVASVSADKAVNVGSADNNTGDHSNMIFWILMLAGTTLIGAIIVVTSRRRQK